MAQRRDTGPDVNELADELGLALTMLDYANRLDAEPQKLIYGGQVEALVEKLPVDVAERVRARHDHRTERR